ncbi:ABC transporter permease [Pedobacter gandavensis]|uniref:ABC transporter permease n=1 Tax=Pedobacter gandavensis TaxID=2679963 RepID=UPI0029300769|nr:FtsX-like permease family protein [Pedobacter gandavensis]
MKMAWRDSRKNRSRLLLFMSSIILGIAALVAVYSFKANLQRDIDEQAKTLTGADLIIQSRRPLSPAITKFLDTLGETRSMEKNFVSMVYFIKGEGSRLVEIKALTGAYPFYGTIESQPVAAAQRFRTGRKALVDRTLMMQYQAKPGDSIKIGNLSFVIEGSLESVPGQTSIVSTVTPVVYIPLKYLEQTGLTQLGSRIQTRYFYQYKDVKAVNSDLKRYEPLLEKEQLSYETVATKKERVGRAFENLSKFLALSGFIALLLGCIGVGTSIQVYIKEKLAAIATLRCLGLNAKEAFLIYLIQVAVIGFLGAIVGAILGTAMQFLLPLVLKDFLPLELSMGISWAAIGQGLATGLVISILFALPSLISVRSISPLNAIRASFEEKGPKRDLLKWVVYLLIIGFIYGFTYLQMKDGLQAFAFVIAILIAFLLLVGQSKLLMLMLRKMIPERMAYVWRQGFANLYRPNNQTMLLSVAIGLSTLFIVTLYLVQGVLLNKIEVSGDGAKSNTVLFDVQPAQNQPLEKLLKAKQLPVLGQVPIITMRIIEINGKTAAQHGDKTDKESKNQASRAFKGEIRATYQTNLRATERLTGGKWTGAIAKDGTVFISLEKDYADRIKVGLGDSITFDVQGMPVKTKVGSFRAVDWNTVQPNFRVVFPSGVLEDAPKFYVFMTHVTGAQQAAALQAKVLKQFPNVSIVNLDMIVKAIDSLLDKINFVIRFMAGFSMATGWIVLLSSVMSSKVQRLKESVLLRTMGASRKQILTITGLEYLFLGFIATAAGIILAILASWALAVFALNSNYAPEVLPLVVFLLAIPLLVMLTGLYSSRSVLNHPPLEILRKES